MVFTQNELKFFRSDDQLSVLKDDITVAFKYNAEVQKVAMICQKTLNTITCSLPKVQSVGQMS